jgi:23S rRNA (guanosine2251-2'-O)-methyltransferase
MPAAHRAGRGVDCAGGRSILSTALRTLFGLHAVTARLRAAPASIRELYVDAKRVDGRMRDLLALAAEKSVRAMAIDAARLDALAGGTVRHQGVVARVDGEARRSVHFDDLLEELPQAALLVVLDGVQDPHNLGAILRVADAMGVDAVIAPKDRAVGITATVEKVASGAAETVRYVTVTNLARTLDQLQARGIWCLGADEAGQGDLFGARLTGPLAWVLGAEGEGLRRLTRERCDELVRIPMFGAVESVNVSVAAGICLFETRRQRAAAAPAC